MALKPLTNEEVEKLNGLKGANNNTSSIEDVLEAEFLMKFGFESYWALYPEKDRSRGIGIDEMMRLLMASRKQDAKTLYTASQASFIGSISSQAKNPSSAFSKTTKGIIKDMKAE